MKITYYGHACFSLEVAGKHLLFDPFISPNEKAAHIDKAKIPADYIFLSHGHQDHVADAVDMANATGAKVICNWEIYEWLGKQGVTNIHPMNMGGTKDLGGFKVKCVVAQHSSIMPDGCYGGNPMGFLILSAEGNYYYAGDTALTLDMQLIPLWCQLDACIFPIGDNFTMGISDAILAADFVKCNTIVGVHYDTFGYIVIDHEKAIQQFAQKGKTLHLLEIGERREV